MPWKGKRKSFSLRAFRKANPLKRRKLSSRKFSKKKSMKRTTWKRGSKKSLFRRKAPSTRKIWRKLSQIPIPAKNLWVDQFACTVMGGVTGMTVLTGLAHMAGALATAAIPTTGALIPLFTSSPLDLGLVLGQAFSNITFAGPPGAVKFNLHEYQHSCQIANSSNYPVKVTRYALFVKNEVPAVYAVDSTQTTASPGVWTFDYLVSYLAYTSLMASNTSSLSTPMDLPNSISPWNSSVLGDSARMAITMPGFKLTDIPIFNHYFRFCGQRSKELLPGRSVTWRVKSKKLRVIDTSYYIDATTYAGVSPALLGSLKVLAMKGSIHYVYKFEPIAATNHATPQVSTTLAPAQCAVVQTYRYITSVSSQPTHQMYGSTGHLGATTAVVNYVPFTATSAAFTPP